MPNDYPPLRPDETVDIIRRKILGELPLKHFRQSAAPDDPAVPHDLVEEPLAAVPAGERKIFVMIREGGCDLFQR